MSAKVIYENRDATSAAAFSLLKDKVKHAKNVMFNKYLFLTNMAISVGLSGVGDLIQQNYMITKGEKATWDKIRTRNMSLTGLSVGILTHNWYMFLDKKLPGRTMRVVLKKVLIDQVVYSPVYITVFFVTSGLLENSSLKEIKEEIIEKGLLLYTAEWIVWPPAQLLNFYFIPPKYRLLYDSTISLGYDIYTSYIKNDVEVDSSNKQLK